MIGFLGGTGPEGRGLALRLALAGEPVIVGSRDAGRAQEAADRIKERGGMGNVSGGANQQAAEAADVVFITVPYDAQRALLEPLAGALAGKTVVCTVAPVSFEGGVISALDVPEGSAAQQAQAILRQSQVAAAFQNVSAADLWVPRRVLEGDVIVCSDHADAKERVMALAPKIASLRAVDGGGLANARYVEEITALLLNINHIHKARTMVKITGLKDAG